MNLRKLSDGKIALILGLIVVFGMVFVCGYNHVWGDDFAAYILEGRAIANGTLEQQVRGNVLLHPSTFFSADLQNMPELVYVWGYPLLIAALYRLFGDAVSITTMFFMCKLINCISAGVIAAVGYLFFRKRFRRMTAFILTCMLSNVYFEWANHIVTDVVFTCFCVVSYFLYEWWDEQETPNFVGGYWDYASGACMCFV